MKKRVAAIVVTYNRKVLLQENIESLLAQTYRDYMDIIVVDNASTDGTKEYIA
ncbi:MAG: glycosyltransferase, partial [Lachnospiraceae bacterium]|nr:glycosyltransferase [Lachnospiraceae bacterium]